MKTRSSLIRRVGDMRDEAAWGEFYNFYFPYILGIFARKSSLKDEDANDLAQDLLTKLVVVLPRFRRERDGSFRAFVRRCAENAWIDFVRARRKVATLSGEALESALGEPAREDYFRAVETAYNVDLAQAALKTLAASEAARVRVDPQCKLHPDAPALIEPLLLDKIPVDEAAKLLGLSPGAVRVQVSRWKDDLKAEIEKLRDSDDA